MSKIELNFQKSAALILTLVCVASSIPVQADGPAPDSARPPVIELDQEVVLGPGQDVLGPDQTKAREVAKEVASNLFDYSAKIKAEMIQTSGEKAGSDDFDRQVIRENIEISTDRGTAKLTYIDRSWVAKVELNSLPMPILIVNANEVREDSPHLRQYLSRLHIEKGQDTLAFFIDPSGGIRSSSTAAVPSRLSVAAVKEFWWAKYKPWNPLFGVIIGGARTLMAAAMVHDYRVIALTFAYSFSIAAWNNMYRNILRPGSRPWQYLKALPFGLSYFLISKVLLLHGQGPMALYLPTILVSLTDTYSSNERRQFNFIREEMHLNDQPIVVRVGNWKTEFNRANFEAEGIKLLYAGAAMAATFGLSHGQNFFWLLTFSTQFAVLTYAKAVGYKKIKQLVRYSVPSNLAYWAFERMRESEWLKEARAYCESFLDGSPTLLHLSDPIQNDATQ